MYLPSRCRYDADLATKRLRRHIGHIYVKLIQSLIYLRLISNSYKKACITPLLKKAGPDEEAVEITYDPEKTSYKNILDFFF